MVQVSISDIPELLGFIETDPIDTRLFDQLTITPAKFETMAAIQTVAEVSLDKADSSVGICADLKDSEAVSDINRNRRVDTRQRVERRGERGLRFRGRFQRDNNRGNFSYFTSLLINELGNILVSVDPLTWNLQKDEEKVATDGLIKNTTVHLAGANLVHDPIRPNFVTDEYPPFPATSQTDKYIKIMDDQVICDPVEGLVQKLFKKNMKIDLVTTDVAFSALGVYTKSNIDIMLSLTTQRFGDHDVAVLDLLSDSGLLASTTAGANDRFVEDNIPTFSVLTRGPSIAQQSTQAAMTARRPIKSTGKLPHPSCEGLPCSYSYSVLEYRGTATESGFCALVRSTYHGDLQVDNTERVKIVTLLAHTDNTLAAWKRSSDDKIQQLVEIITKNDFLYARRSTEAQLAGCSTLKVVMASINSEDDSIRVHSIFTNDPEKWRQTVGTSLRTVCRRISKVLELTKPYLKETFQVLAYSRLEGQLALIDVENEEEFLDSNSQLHY